MGAAHQWRLFRPLVRMIGRSLLFIIAVLVLWLLPPAPFRPPLVFVVVVAMGLVVPFIIGLRISSMQPTRLPTSQITSCGFAPSRNAQISGSTTSSEFVAV